MPSETRITTTRAEDRTNGTGNAIRLPCLLPRQRVGIDGDERGGKHTFTEQILEKVGKAKRGVERRRHQTGAEVVRDELLSNEAEQSRRENARGDQRGAASRVCGFAGAAGGTGEGAVTPPERRGCERWFPR